MTSISDIPKHVKTRLGPVRRMYVATLLAGGLHGNTAEEVVETIFCRGLQECIDAGLMRSAHAWLEARKAAKSRKLVGLHPAKKRRKRK